MAMQIINGQEVELPDDLTPAELDLIKNSIAQPQPETKQEEPGIMGRLFGTVDPASLSSDEDWLKSSNEIYKANHGKDFDGDASELAEYGLDQMGWFNYNMPAMIMQTRNLYQMSDEQKKSFLYLMDTYDNLKISWGGTGRFIKGASIDPTTYMGLSTFGFSTLATQGGKAATKAGIKEILKGAVKTGVVSAIENGIQAGAQSAVKQQAEHVAGRGDGISLGRTVAEAGVGAAMGFGLGAAGSAAVGVGRKALRGSEKAVQAGEPLPGTTLADEAFPPASDVPRPENSPPVPKEQAIPEAANDNAGPGLTAEQPRTDAAPAAAANDNSNLPAPKAVEMEPGVTVNLKQFVASDPEFNPPANDPNAVTDFFEQRSVTRSDAPLINPAFDAVDNLIADNPWLATPHSMAGPDELLKAVSTWKSDQYATSDLFDYLDQSVKESLMPVLEKIRQDPRFDPSNLAHDSMLHEMFYDAGGSMNWFAHSYLDTDNRWNASTKWMKEYLVDEIKPKTDVINKIKDSINSLDTRQSNGWQPWTDHPYKTGVPTYVDAFHGTSRVFSGGFDTSKMGAATAAEDARQGWFFSRSPETAENYAVNYSPSFHSAATPEQMALYESLEKVWQEADNELARIRNEHEKSTGEWLSMYDAKKQWPDIAKKKYDALQQMDELRQEVASPKANLIMARLKFMNPLVIDRKGAGYTEHEYTKFVKQARANGHDGIILIDAADGGPTPDTAYIVLKENTDSSIRFKYDRDEQRAASAAKTFFTDSTPMPMRAANDDVPQTPKALGADVPTKGPTSETITSGAPANENRGTAQLGNPENKPTPPVAANSNLDQVSDGAGPIADRIMAEIRRVVDAKGLTVYPKTKEDLDNASAVSSHILSKVNTDDVVNVVKQLFAAETEPERQLILKKTFQQASALLEEQAYQLKKSIDNMADGAEKTALTQQLAMLKNVRDVVKAGDTALSSMSGTELGMRAGEFNTGSRRDQFASEDAYLRSQGVDPALATPEERQIAEEAYFKAYEEWKTRQTLNKDIATLEYAAEDALRKGDIAEVNKLLAQRDAIVDQLAKQTAAERGVLRNALSGNIMRGTMEYIIGTVFTTGSFVVNTVPSMVKTIYRPLLDGAVEGFDAAARRKMSATYGAMLSNVDAAFKAAALSLRYEKTFMTDDLNRMLEAPSGVIPGWTGRTIRFLPNLLNATDVFFMQVNYRGFVAGEAAARAYERGVQLGFKGKRLDQYVKMESSKYLKNSFSDKVQDINVLDSVRQRGMSKGLKGSDLDAWMALELKRNGEFMKEATNQGGIDFVKDLTFKKEFSGDGFFSGLARSYEKTVQNEPWLKLMGQLFFRTPVRVFQEGFRMTPVLGLITPTKMMSDLIGKNGKQAYTKAMGELLLAQTFAGAFAILYAQNKLSGGGSPNYKERRSKENTKQWEPYSLDLGDGTFFSYRNLDPFGTPFKIMANTMDRLMELDYRKRQGEYTGKEEEYLYSVAQAGLVSIAQAVRDANLTEGIDSIVQAYQKATDENSDGQFLPRLLFQKLQLLVPNMARKAIQTNDPTLADPLTFEQHARALINPSDPHVPKRYDILGNVVKAADPGDAFFGFRTTTAKQREKGLSNEHLLVLSALNDLEVATGSNLTRPYKHTLFGDVDLRRKDTPDGKESTYDRMMTYYHESGVDKRLYKILVENGYGSVGTPRQHGDLMKAVKEQIDAAWDGAAARVFREDRDARDALRAREFDKADVLRGNRDIRPPF